MGPGCQRLAQQLPFREKSTPARVPPGGVPGPAWLLVTRAKGSAARVHQSIDSVEARVIPLYVSHLLVVECLDGMAGIFPRIPWTADAGGVRCPRNGCLSG